MFELCVVAWIYDFVCVNIWAHSHTQVIEGSLEMFEDFLGKI